MSYFCSQRAVYKIKWSSDFKAGNHCLFQQTVNVVLRVNQLIYISLLSIIHANAFIHVLYMYLIAWCSYSSVWLLHLVLHTAKPAAVTTVAMETCGVSEEKVFDRGKKRQSEQKRGREEKEQGNK